MARIFRSRKRSYIDSELEELKKVISFVLSCTDTTLTRSKLGVIYYPWLKSESERQKALMLVGQCVIGVFWVYFLYHCWNHSEHHLVHAGFPNPLGEVTDAVTGHYVGWKGSGAMSARIETIDKVLSIMSF